MADENNIKQFNAADIEKYHRGLLSSKERHDLEKAAMDDPFLADALEGYNTAGVNNVADMEELKNRLKERTTTGKVVTMNKGRLSPFAWWKAAAMIILIGGAGFLVYRFSFVNNKHQEVAKLQQENKVESLLKKDSLTNEPVVATINNESSITVQDKSVTNSGTALKQKETSKSGIPEINNNNMFAATDTLSITAFKKDAELPVITTPSKQETEKFQNTDITKADTKLLTIKNNQDAGKIEIPGKSYKQYPVAASQNKAETIAGKNSYSLSKNNFRGRVMDAENNPLPFASIINEAEKEGTYADANGYFTLTSPDSIMNVQIKSVGFENNTVALRSNIASNQVVLQGNRNSMSEVVVTAMNQNTNRLKEVPEANLKIKGPEPFDGWSNYDIYILNNLRIPEEKRDKQLAGLVEISFDINKNGRPVNFKIEKSLCKPCDEEAIRLVKEGPRWKKSKKNARARVAVPFKD